MVTCKVFRNIDNVMESSFIDWWRNCKGQEHVKKCKYNLIYIIRKRDWAEFQSFASKHIKSVLDISLIDENKEFVSLCNKEEKFSIDVCYDQSNGLYYMIFFSNDYVQFRKFDGKITWQNEELGIMTYSYSSRYRSA